jgi:hypothetical protein
MHAKFHNVGHLVKSWNAHRRMCARAWNCDSCRMVTSMEQSDPWEDHSEIPCLLWKWKVSVCVHKSPPTVPILSQTYPPQIPTTQLFKIHFYIILLSTSRHYDKIFMHFSSLPCVLNATPISSSFILPASWYLAGSMNDKGIHWQLKWIKSVLKKWDQNDWWQH